MRIIPVAFALAALSLTTACTNTQAYLDDARNRPMRTEWTPAASRGLGAILGAGGGAVLGNQFGKGSGKTAMTIAGGVAGAVGGHMLADALTRDDSSRSAPRDTTIRTQALAAPGTQPAFVAPPNTIVARRNQDGSMTILSDYNQARELSARFNGQIPAEHFVFVD